MEHEVDYSLMGECVCERDEIISGQAMDNAAEFLLTNWDHRGTLNWKQFVLFIDFIYALGKKGLSV